MNRLRPSFAILIAMIWCIAVAPAADEGTLAERRQKAQTLQKQGNYKEALDIFREIATDPDAGGDPTAEDVRHIQQCLQRLHRVDERDAIVEAVADAHQDDWRVLQAVSQVYANGQHWGYMIGGEFHRGQHRGGGRRAHATERDRTRALQLLDRAREAAKADPDKQAAARFFLQFADFLMNARGSRETWRLQYLTDLDTLPDYDEASHYSRDVGTPVDPAGKPIYYDVPASWQDAESDGERWRWLLMQATEYDSNRTGDALMRFAGFLRDQFGVQTMANQYGRFFRGHGRVGRDDEREDTSGTYALHTLDETETITRLANGVHRHTLPDAFNFIHVYQRIAGDENCRGEAENALHTLARIFQNRRQYVAAAAYWQKSIDRFGPGRKDWKRKRLEQIVDNWGRFDGPMADAAGTPATLGFVFRNAGEVTFDAHRIDVPTLLEDIKRYIKSDPRRLKRERVQLGDIGRRLVHNEPGKYTDKTPVKSWTLTLDPARRHWDKRIDVDTGLDQAGAYLVTAKVADGNTSYVVVWLNDTVIARKSVDQGMLYYVADAVTGEPIEKATVAFFGYRREWKNRRHKITTMQSAEFSDADGLVTCREDRYPRQYQWLVTVNREGTERFAYLGFSSVWYGRHREADYHATKVFTITDRPVYRPGQDVHLKSWVRHAAYDKADTSSFAENAFEITVTNPKGDEVFKATRTADAYGGIKADLALEDDATLGSYRIAVVNPDHVHPISGKHVGRRQIGSGSFRVEEYKKPEYEVTVEAPTEPVMLGETVTATIKAAYYFGAPVTDATVSYKVLRHNHDAQWYPPLPWNWLYGPGYWWFDYDYTWYPGWSDWGCARPTPWWWHRGAPPPEVVSENEVEIGEDGTVEIDIDTSFAKAVHGDIDHRYEITAEVVDASRRTIVGKGKVLVARKPFSVTVWTDRGHYRVGEGIDVHAAARTLDGNGVAGKSKLTLYRVSYDAAGQPEETPVQSWDLTTGDDGELQRQVSATKAGQYRLACHVTDAAGHSLEGATMLVIRGEGFDGRQFRFNPLELVNDRPDYAPGETVKLMVNTDREDSTVLLFVRPSNGVCQPPRVLRLDGKSSVAEIEVTRQDMPNFFVEALTVSDGNVYSEVREIVVPPEKRVLNVDVIAAEPELGPGEAASVTLKLTDFFGKPFVGSTVVTVYDKALEYIAGGSNVGDIRSFFWKWRRRHQSRTWDNVSIRFANIVPPGGTAMSPIGVFGRSVADDLSSGLGDEARTRRNVVFAKSAGRGRGGGGPQLRVASAMAVPARDMAEGFAMNGAAVADDAMMAAKASTVAAATPGDDGGGEAAGPMLEPTVRAEFADLVYWTAALETDSNGVATVSFDMPENLTTWKVKTWAMGHGTVVGAGETELITSKDVIVRLQAPRFFVEKDEVVLSAVVHNYLENAKDVEVALELAGDTLSPMPGVQTRKRVRIDADGEARVDWRVKVTAEGEAVITMKALTDEESDAMQMTFPVYVHGMLKMDAFSGVVRPDASQGAITLNVPTERRIAQSRLEVRYSPTLAGALVDALPYLVGYPYGCTEQTLNRFLPTVLTQKILLDLGLDLAAIRDKQTNLNAQEIGDDAARAKQWQRDQNRNPVFDPETVEDMTREGLKRLYDMQCSDGGWGWFSGWGERSYPHTTATVIHGLQVARANDVAVVPGVLQRGIRWLVQYQEKQVQRIKNAPKKKHPWKSHADNLDAFVFMVLIDSDELNTEMRDFLYRDRNHLSVYAKAMTAVAMDTIGETEKRDMLRRNIEQYLVQDDENQTACLKLGNAGYWWHWYGSEIEAHAYYLKLLNRVAPKGDIAPRLVKYLLNNRKHATYWDSTRDTALCIEAMAGYLRASGEDKPDMTVRIDVDGREMKSVRITPEDLFMFDNKLVLKGDAIEDGEHTVTITREGNGPVYYNAYLSNFTLADFITRAGLEIKVNRRVYKLVAVDKTTKVVGAHGQAVDQDVEAFKRVPLENEARLKSGDLVEVELLIESKNDYEYLVFEDFKAAGFEPVDLRSGYTDNAMNAYVEFRDEKVAFFVRKLARGRHSVSYRLRAEIPGRFSALPARGYAMYAPELKANSDEIKLRIED